MLVSQSIVLAAKVKQIVLSSTIHDNLMALVDDEDYERLAQFTWHPMVRDNVTYAYRQMWDGVVQNTILMHQCVLNAEFIDHKDGNGLNNQKSNLRAATNSQNQANSPKTYAHTSKYRGVFWRKDRNKWRAQIAANFIGYYDSELEAAKAYNKAAIERWGEFAENSLNKLEEAVVSG